MSATRRMEVTVSSVAERHHCYLTRLSWYQSTWIVFKTDVGTAVGLYVLIEHRITGENFTDGQSKK